MRIVKSFCCVVVWCLIIRFGGVVRWKYWLVSSVILRFIVVCWMFFGKLICLVGCGVWWRLLRCRWVCVRFCCVMCR